MKDALSCVAGSDLLLVWMIALSTMDISSFMYWYLIFKYDHVPAWGGARDLI